MNEYEGDPVRWFDALGACACGRPAHGTLRGPRNESFGIACTKCAERRVAKAVAARKRRADEASRSAV